LPMNEPRGQMRECRTTPGDGCQWGYAG
jgi:hypothetical protein